MPSVELRNAVRTNLLETVLSVILILAGGALTFEQSVSVRFAGYVISTCGTVLVSWALTRAWVARQHQQELTRSLQAITRPLSTVAGQLSYAVHRASSDGNDSIESQIVTSAIQHVYGVVTELQSLIGSPISVEEIVAIKDRLETLGEELAAAEVADVPEPSPGAAETKQRAIQLADEINSIKLQLESAVIKKDRQYRNETAVCTRCHAPVSVTLGTIPGDSALPTCSGCGTRFHVHRSTDGTIFTRPWGGTNSTAIQVSCPHCGNKVPLTLAGTEVAAQQRYCLKCFGRLAVDPKTLAVTAMQPPQEPLTGTLSLDHLSIACPNCGRQYKTLYGREGVYFAVCPTESRLLRAWGVPSGMAARGSVAGSS